MTVTADEARQHFDRLERDRRRAGEERARVLTERLPGAVEVLRRRGAARVWLFGSLAEGTTRETSDVDLAVEGLPALAYFDALGEVMAHLKCPVDLVRIETAAATLRERILECGRELG